MAEEYLDSRKKPEGGNPKRLIFVSIVLVIVILAVLVVVYYKKGKEVSKEEQATVTPVTSATQTVATSPTPDRVVDDGVTWSSPVKLSDLGLVKQSKDESAGSEYKGTEYFKVGSTSSGAEIILAKVKMASMGESYNFYRFLKRDGKYYEISRNSYEGYYSELYSIESQTVESDFVLASLLPDQKITFGSTNLILQESMGGDPDFDSMTGGKKVGETRWGSLYLKEGDDLDKSEGIAKTAHYYVVLNDSTKAGFEPSPSFMRDDSTFNLSNMDAGAKSVKFSKVATGGCGSTVGSFPIITSKSSLTGKKELGTSTSGSKAYYITDTSSSVLKYGYEMYKMDGLEGKKSIEEFAKNYGVVFWTDDYGTTQIYMNQDYLPQVECGKPVVYLYPTQETKVSVKVGADITVSEPAYKEGWEALASPSGKLIVDGKAYSNLFWEGIGWGKYPKIKTGTVVETASAKTTIKNQLSAMNLNDQEIADFLEFWLPKMPKTKYVRISWFYGEDMDNLAPLKITPKPDSVIRVFMDFAGLDQKESVLPQTLPRFARNGFTAVEWGGLLIK